MPVPTRFGGPDEIVERDLRPAERAKLDTMVKALINRPGLSLGLEGGFDGPADTFALRRLKLAQLVRARIWQEVRATNPNLPPPDKIQLSPEAYDALWKKNQAYFEKKFGVDLTGRPTMITVRGRCRAEDGGIHTDSVTWRSSRSTSWPSLPTPRCGWRR